jgi:hypothetical protein
MISLRLANWRRATYTAQNGAFHSQESLVVDTLDILTTVEAVAPNGVDPLPPCSPVGPIIEILVSAGRPTPEQEIVQ